MPLIVEDGTVVQNANSYVTLAEADAYFSERSDADEWAALDDDVKTQKLIDGADYLNSVYRWKGSALDLAQTMALPTDYVTDIVWPVKRAQMVLARFAMTGALAPEVTKGIVTKERKKLDGVGEKEYEYEYASSPELGRTFPIVDAMLNGLIITKTGSGSIQVARRIYG